MCTFAGISESVSVEPQNAAAGKQIDYDYHVWSELEEYPTAVQYHIVWGNAVDAGDKGNVLVEQVNAVFWEQSDEYRFDYADHCGKPLEWVIAWKKHVVWLHDACAGDQKKDYTV